MEMLRQDMKRNEDLLISPDWHHYELAATEQRVASREKTFMDWEVTKKLLRQRFKKIDY